MHASTDDDTVRNLDFPLQPAILTMFWVDKAPGFVAPLHVVSGPGAIP